MSPEDQPSPEGACVRCLRRSWLISELSPLLDYERGRPERLRELLALPDEHLIDALAGSRKGTLHATYDEFPTKATGDRTGLDTLCRHRERYPKALARDLPAAALYIGGSRGVLDRLTQQPVVAIVGSRHPSDYGIRMSRSIARGLAACGITVLSELQRGLAEAAHRGALELRAGTLAVTRDGLACARKARRALYEELVDVGCVLGELEPNAHGRGWGSTACADMLLALASVLVVIEAEETSQEMTLARLAMQRGALVAAMPGRVESPLATGPHALLLKGASLIRGAHDVLELLYQEDTPTTTELSPSCLLGTDGLPSHLRPLLRQILSGNDTPQKILAGSTPIVDGLAALSELELTGLISRTAGGRYIPAEPSPAKPASW